MRTMSRSDMEHNKRVLEANRKRDNPDNLKIRLDLLMRRKGIRFFQGNLQLTIRDEHTQTDHWVEVPKVW